MVLLSLCLLKFLGHRDIFEFVPFYFYRSPVPLAHNISFKTLSLSRLPFFILSCLHTIHYPPFLLYLDEWPSLAFLRSKTDLLLIFLVRQIRTCKCLWFSLLHVTGAKCRTRRYGWIHWLLSRTSGTHISKLVTAHFHGLYYYTRTRNEILKSALHSLTPAYYPSSLILEQQLS